MTNFRKYLKLCGWARKRYQDDKGYLLIKTGPEWSIYSRIEQAASIKYLRIIPQ